MYPSEHNFNNIMDIRFHSHKFPLEIYELKSDNLKCL